MRHILSLLLLLLVLTACDMDCEPYDSIPDTEALHTAKDYSRIRTGLYAPLRTLCSGSFLIAQELQADGFNAVEGFTGSYSDMHRWLFNAGDATFSDVYGSWYALAARCNFVIDGTARCDTTTFSADEKLLVGTTVGEAYLLRAMSFFQIAQLFCTDYNDDTADRPDGGISLQLHYQPTANSASYPARSTLRKTYQQICDDLDEAEARISERGRMGSNYITTDIVHAMKARVALAMQQWEVAAELATSLINSRRYILVADRREYRAIWQEDAGTETLWQLPITSLDELASRTGYDFRPYQPNAINYLPTAELLGLYDQARDIRFGAFFSRYHLTVPSGAQADVYLFNKFPDSTAVFRQLGRSESGRFQSEPKVIRIAELYLIAAEAYARLGQTAAATAWLNLLRKSRIVGYENESFATQATLLEAVRDERRRELVGEGQRLVDLKRWHLGVHRGEPQAASVLLFPGSTTTTKLSRTADDPRMVWPIPQAEIDANPQLRHHQNPGY